VNQEAPDFYRQEAVEYHLSEKGGKGDVLQLTPVWIRWTYRLIILFSLVGIAFLCVGQVHEYAAGPAVIRAQGRSDITAHISATVTEVTVQPGQRVERGALLVQFEASAQLRDLERVEREIEIQLTSRLRDPLDRTSEQTLTGLQSQREYAEQQVRARAIYAPNAGVVSDIRTRPGQALVPGQIAVILLSDDPQLVVEAALPGHYRPQLESGLPVRLELSGYSHAYQTLTLESISDEVIGPAEARRFLGTEVADVMSISGPVILVRASIPRSEFRSGRQSYQYYDGMHGRLEVCVQSEPIIIALIPGLKYFTEGKHDQ